MKSSKNKIAIYHSLPSGGGKRVLEDFCRHFKSDLYLLPKSRFGSFFHYYFYVLFKLKKEHKKVAEKINSNNYDLVFVSTDQLIKCPYILKHIKHKKVYYCHEEPREFYGDKIFLNTNFKSKLVNFLRFPFKIIDKNNIRYADLLLTNSQFSKEKLEKIYNREFEVLYPGVSENFYKQNIKKKKFYLTVGATSIFKGIDFIIKSIAKLPDKYKFPLYIIGDKGRDYKNISDLAKKLNIKLVIRKGIKDNELRKLYNQASLVLAAAHNEPLGLSLIESISCGTKVVAINEGGYREIINNSEHGELVDRNEEKFTKAIIRNVGKEISKQDTIRFKEKWSWENTINNFNKIVENFL